jgi:hypothetical protein
MRGLFELLTDPYDRQARATPALMVVLPLLLPVVAHYGLKHPALTAILAVLSSCGAIYTLSNIARGRGKALEKELLTEWGGLPSTIALRHRDGHLNPVTKRGYHEAIEAKLHIKMPSAEDERADPFAADHAYEAAGIKLRELTRGDKKLLLKENVAYGFHRNMVAMKPLGIFVCVVALVFCALLSKAVRWHAPYFDTDALANPGIAAGLGFLVAFAMLGFWLLHFRRSVVKTFGYAYADRLFESISSVKALTKKRGKPPIKPDDDAQPATGP